MEQDVKPRSGGTTVRVDQPEDSVMKTDTPRATVNQNARHRGRTLSSFDRLPFDVIER
jgi:hypothetical protein